MREYEVYGTVTVEFSIPIEASSMEEAKRLCEETPVAELVNYMTGSDEDEIEVGNIYPPMKSKDSKND